MNYLITEEQRQQLLDALRVSFPPDSEQYPNLEADHREAVQVLQSLAPVEDRNSIPTTYAYAVYFPDQPTEELVHELDDLCEDMTNREHSVIKLFDHPAPLRELSDADIQKVYLKVYNDGFKGRNLETAFARAVIKAAKENK